MKLDFTEQGRFVPETSELADQLQADAVVLLVFGAAERGSGCCCEIRSKEPRGVSEAIIDTLRDLADSMEMSLREGFLDDNNGYEQEKQ